MFTMTAVYFVWPRECHYTEALLYFVDLFEGQLKSALTCTECGYVSNTFDPALGLSLPIKKVSCH